MMILSGLIWHVSTCKWGFTRARRYANYKGGKKYDKHNDYNLLERGTGENEKAKSAEVFFEIWKKAEANETYKSKKLNWKSCKG